MASSSISSMGTWEQEDPGAMTFSEFMPTLDRRRNTKIRSILLIALTITAVVFLAVFLPVHFTKNNVRGRGDVHAANEAEDERDGFIDGLFEPSDFPSDSPSDAPSDVPSDMYVEWTSQSANDQ